MSETAVYSASNDVGRVEQRWMLPPVSEPIDELPTYKTAIVRRASASFKHEMSSPFKRSVFRTWMPADVWLNNTQIEVQTRVTKQRSVYSLQYAEVGLATDYDKRPYVLRVRAEAQQFLLALESMDECVAWLEALQAAIDVALPLDLRPQPELTRGRYYTPHPYMARAAAAAGTGAGAVSCPEKREPPQERLDVTRRHAYLSSIKFDLRDFRHLRQKSSWQGKQVLFRGHWCIVDQNTLLDIVS